MTYDLAGRILQISTPVVSGDPSTGAFQYSYDTAGRLLVQTMPNSNTVTYQLDANGNRTQLTWPDAYYAQYVFDQLNRLTDIKLNGSSSSALNFQYDELSRRTQLTYQNGCVCTYAYALNNDMTSLGQAFVGSSVTFGFSYNNVHQVIGTSVSDGSFVWKPSALGVSSYSTANNLNQYPAVGGTSFGYDNNGCLTSGPLTASFDALSRVTQVVSGSTTNNYWTDPLNRQAQKEVGSTKTGYLYDGQQLIADYNSSGTLLDRYIPGARLDEVLIQIAGSTLTFNHMDRLGSTIAQTNAPGAVINTYQYSPFGETPSLTGATFGFTGQRYDSEIGLYNYKARYYAPAIGRFLQPDPLGYGAGDMNLYSYVGNDALNFTDPLGLQAAPSSCPQRDASRESNYSRDLAQQLKDYFRDSRTVDRNFVTDLPWPNNTTAPPGVSVISLHGSGYGDMSSTAVGGDINIERLRPYITDLTVIKACDSGVPLQPIPGYTSAASAVAQYFGVSTIGYLGNVPSWQILGSVPPAAVLYNSSGVPVMTFQSPMTKYDWAFAQTLATTWK